MPPEQNGLMALIITPGPLRALSKCKMDHQVGPGLNMYITEDVPNIFTN